MTQEKDDLLRDEEQFIDGMATYYLSSWSEFSVWLANTVYGEIQDQLADDFEFVWRGQRDDGWTLTPSFDRILLDLPHETQVQLSQKHLATFRQNARGRRSSGSPKPSNDDEWWALGQHYGLATPLLDWTPSPYAAAYFAFEDKFCNTDYRVVFALNRTLVERRNLRIEENDDNPGLYFLSSDSDDNPRLVSQGGLFTKGPIGIDVASWVQTAFSGHNIPVLLQVKIPNHERYTCLKELTRMNIHHLSLFPDLAGACRYTNMQLEAATLKEALKTMDSENV